MVLHSIVGMQNGGKTLIAEFFCFLDFLRGRKILSNIHLSFPHYKINIDFIYKCAIEQPLFRNCTWLIDESWIWFDSRNAMKGYKGIGQNVGTFFFLQSSKDNSNIFMTAQTNEQNEIRIQRNLHRLTECRRVIKTEKGYKPVEIDERDLSNYKSNEGIPLNDLLYIHALNKKKNLSGDFVFSSNLYLKAKEYFKMYNTYEKRKV